MVSLSELKRELSKQKAIAQVRRDMERYDREKSKVKREIFNLKHARTIGRAKRAGRRLSQKGKQFLDSIKLNNKEK